MWSDLLMTSAICCPLWSSLYECHKVECVFTSPVRTECGMFVAVTVMHVLLFVLLRDCEGDGNAGVE